MAESITLTRGIHYECKARRISYLLLTSVLLLVTFVDSAAISGAEGRESGDTIENAFAVIGPALVKGNFHQYPPFYSNVIAPHAVLTKDRIYTAFQNTKGQPVVMVYDIANRSWSGPVTASEFGLGKDAHGNPSICIDRRGHIHIFYGCHGRGMRYTRSAEPYNITKWQEQPAPTSSATYPQSICMADGSIFLFYRAGGHVQPWSARYSQDDGRSWSEAEKVIEMRLDPPDRLAAAYASICPGYSGKTVHCFWVHKDDNAVRVRGDRKHPWRPLKYKGFHEAVYRYNMYYIYRDREGIWRNAAGKKVELPVSKAFADKHFMVYDSGDDFTNIGFPFVDKKNRPYVRFRTGVGDWKAGGRIIKPWHSLYAHYDAGKWQVNDEVPDSWPKEARAFGTGKGSVAFGPKSQVDWFIYFTNDRFNPNQGSSIFLYNEEHGYATRRGGPVRLTRRPVKVFLLAGQSNMEGQGVVSMDHERYYNGGRGNLVNTMKDPSKAHLYKHLKDENGEWIERDDVKIRFRERCGGLTIGYTGYGRSSHIGPELQFGHVVGDYYDEPVLLVKTAWGGKSLYKDFRPPSSGGTVGEYYKRMLEDIHNALDQMDANFPDLAGRGYEIAGFVWMQGWNDMCEPKAIPEYDKNLINLVKDIRKEFKSPNMPVVIGELGNGGAEARGNMAAFRKAQKKGAEQIDNAAFIITHNFARDPKQSPNVGHGHHWYGNAESYFLIGDALGKGIIKVIENKKLKN